MTCRDREEPGLRADSECRALSGAHSRPWGQPPEGPRHSRGRLNDLGGRMLSGGKREAEGIALRRRIRAGVHGVNPGGRSRVGTGRHSHPRPGHVRTGRGPPSVEGAGSGGLGTTRAPRSQPDPRGRQEVGPSRCGWKRPRCSQRQRFSEDAGGPGGSVSAAGFGLHAGRGQQRGQEEGPGRGSRTGHRGEAQAAQPGEGPGARSARGENGEKVP